MFGFSNENWFFFAAGSVVSLLTLWAGLKLGKAKGAVLWFHPHTSFVLDSPIKIADVQVTFKGQPIPRVVVCDVLFLNLGDSAVHKAMIVDADPLRLVFSGGTVLEASVEDDRHKGSRGISLHTSDDGTEVRVEFDFLNPGDGFEIRLLHTCGPGNPVVKGSLRGATLKR